MRINILVHQNLQTRFVNIYLCLFYSLCSQVIIHYIYLWHCISYLEGRKILGGDFTFSSVCQDLCFTWDFFSKYFDMSIYSWHWATWVEKFGQNVENKCICMQYCVLHPGGILRAWPTDDRSSKTSFLVAVATATDDQTRIGHAVAGCRHL